MKIVSGDVPPHVYEKDEWDTGMKKAGYKYKLINPMPQHRRMYAKDDAQKAQLFQSYPMVKWIVVKL